MMKTLSFVFVSALLSGVFIISGCKNETTSTTSSAALSDDDAANLIAASLAGKSSTNGLTAQMEDAASYAAGGPLGKRTSAEWDTTIVRSDTIGAYSYNYLFRYSAEFSNFGNRLDVTYSMHGTYDIPRFSSDDSANAGMTITHIIDPDSEYTFNVTYVRLGSETSKIGNRRSFTSTISIMLTNVKVGKASRRVNSGTASATVSGQISGGRSFSYFVTINFLGNQVATVSFKGKTYSVNLTTGTATASDVVQ